MSVTTRASEVYVSENMAKQAAVSDCDRCGERWIFESESPWESDDNVKKTTGRNTENGETTTTGRPYFLYFPPFKNRNEIYTRRSAEIESNLDPCLPEEVDDKEKRATRRK